MHHEDMSESLIIEGINQDNKKFRPSNWAERISATLASFGPDQRLCYSKLAHPCIIEGTKCLIVSRELSQHSPEAYDFIMWFARNNNLRIQKDRRSRHEDIAQDRRQQDWQYGSSSDESPPASSAA